jgi:hypothetical protein
VLVFGADRADLILCETARDGLLSVGANLLGLVLNCVPPGTGVYAGDRSYYSYTYNGSSGGNGPRRRGAAVTDVADDGNNEDPTPLVALDPVKTKAIGSRPNQLSR